MIYFEFTYVDSCGAIYIYGATRMYFNGLRDKWERQLDFRTPFLNKLFTKIDSSNFISNSAFV